MSKLKIYHKGKYFSFRAIISTLFGEIADTIIFFLIAFAGMLSVKHIFFMIVAEFFLKSFYEIIVLPITIMLVKYLKKIENTDMFDHNISYNVLKIRDI
jgi:uncharacterized PurR-regulated membrane protein YhhQ (DUF165 family)